MGEDRILFQIVFRAGLTERAAEKILESCGGTGRADLSSSFLHKETFNAKGVR